MAWPVARPRLTGHRRAHTRISAAAPSPFGAAAYTLDGEMLEQYKYSNCSLIEALQRALLEANLETAGQAYLNAALNLAEPAEIVVQSGDPVRPIRSDYSSPSRSSGSRPPSCASSRGSGARPDNTAASVGRMCHCLKHRSRAICGPQPQLASQNRITRLQGERESTGSRCPLRIQRPLQPE